MTEEEEALRAAVDKLRSEATLGSGETLLHLAVKMQHERKHDVVKYLIRSGDVDCDQRDDAGLTACECALARLGDRQLAAVMIEAEFAGVNIGRSFYVLIRRGSVEVFKLFLQLNDFAEGDLFQFVFSAMIELNVKQVEIKVEMERFLQYRLAKYAHQELAGDWKGDRNPCEWRQHFVTIEEHWNVLRKCCDVRCYDGIDNEFLHRVQEIHNCLYFVKDKKFLRHLPMLEVVFYLGIFVSIFKWESEYKLFKYLINKRNIMKFLEVICRQLRMTLKDLDELKRLLEEELKQEVSKDQLITNWNSNNSHWKLGETVFNRLLSGLKKKQPLLAVIEDVIASETFELPTKINGSDQSALRKLRGCYFKTKQLYSIQKSLYYIKAIACCRNGLRTDLFEIPAMKRVIQAIGEAIKCTKNSPNISKKVESTLAQMLTGFFPINNKYFREYFSHKYSLAKKILSRNVETAFLRVLVTQIGYVQMVYSIVYICALVDASRSLLGTMKSCRSRDQLRALLRYVSDLEIVERGQSQYLADVRKFFSRMSEVLTSVEANSQQDRTGLAHLKEHFEQKVMILDFLERCMTKNWGFSFADIKFACEANADILSIQRQIEWNLSFTGLFNIFEEVRKPWLTNHVTLSSLEPTNTALLSINPSVIAGLLSNLERKVCTIETDEYAEETRSILQEFEVPEFSNDQFNAFHKQLLKYYENIFFLDNKFRAIRLFFKSQKWNLDEEILKTSRNKDEKMLQDIFDGYLNEMREILRTEGITTIEELIVGAHQIPAHITMALEYYQLELCEILITAGYFGDSFHLLKHRIPLVHGRNCRNYLAHDSLSYNILADSTRIVVLINAIVMANCKIDLFRSKGRKIDHKFQFPSSQCKLKWMDQQNALFTALKEEKFEEVLSNVQSGGELLGKLHQTIVTQQSGPTGLSLIDPNRAGHGLKTFCVTKFPQISSEIWSATYRSWFALQRGDYELAFNILAKDKPIKNSTLPQDFFSWELIIDYLLIEMQDWDETDRDGRTILHRLILAGNTERFFLLLEIFPDLNINKKDAKGFTPLEYALRFGNTPIAKALLSKNVLISTNSQKLAIINHVNCLLDQLLLNFDPDSLIEKVYIQTAVRANNLHAVKYLVERFYYGSHHYLRSKHLPTCVGLAAYLNHSTIVQYLIGLPSIDYSPVDRNEQNGNTALLYALDWRNWTVVQLLLQHGSSPNWVHPNWSQKFKTAFQLAVHFSSCKIIRMMAALVDKTLYLNNTKLLHPMAIAIENDSTKMIRCLTNYGFDLLNSSQILQAAMRPKKAQFFDLIMRKIDASICECTSTNVLDLIGSLLNRCKLIAFLEEPDQNQLTIVVRALEEPNLNLLVVLLNKYKEILKMSDMFLDNIKSYEQLQLKESLDCGNILDSTTRMRLCEKLLDCMRGFSKVQTNNLLVQFTFNSKVVNCTLLSSEVVTENHIIVEQETENVTQQAFLLLVKLLENSTSLACGALEETTSNSRVYFLICEGTSYLLETTAVNERRHIANLVNFGDKVGETPLHLISTDKEHLPIMELLLEHGSNPLASNSVQQTPLHLALTGQDPRKAVRLLEHCISHNLSSADGINALELPSGLGMRPIHLAAMTGKLEAVHILMDHGVDATAQDTVGATAAMYATSTFHTNILSLLLARYPQSLNIQDKRGQALLHLSTAHHNLETLELILQYDVDLHLRDNDGSSAVELAIERQNPGWLKTVYTYARSKGIPKLPSNTAQKQFPLFHYATVCNNADSLRAIVEYEIDSELTECLPKAVLQKIGEIITNRPEGGFSPLYIAVKLLKERSVEFILYCQQLYNQQMEEKLFLAKEQIDTEDCTLIDVALKSDHETIINLLLASIE